MTTMLTSTIVRDPSPPPRPVASATDTRRRPVVSTAAALGTAVRFVGHLAVACVSVAVVGAGTEH